jgi:hypothetical protein
MTLLEFVSAVQDETCLDDAKLIEALTRANWPDVEDFKPVQVRLMASMIFRRVNGPPDTGREVRP